MVELGITGMMSTKSTNMLVSDKKEEVLEEIIVRYRWLSVRLLEAATDLTTYREGTERYGTAEEALNRHRRALADLDSLFDQWRLGL